MRQIKKRSIENRAFSTAKISLCVVLLCTATLLLAACGNRADGGSSSAAATGAGKIDKSMKSTPCALVSSESVAGIFAIPAADIEQVEASSTCRYRWKEGRNRVDVTVDIDDILDDAKSAAAAFEQLTRNMSRIEGDGGKDIRFEDIGGIADQARFDTASGNLSIRHDNMIFRIEAYAGPETPRRAASDVDMIMEAGKARVRDTLRERKQAAMELAQASIRKL